MTLRLGQALAGRYEHYCHDATVTTYLLLHIVQIVYYIYTTT